MERETPLMWLTDEDLEAIGADPNKISNETFELIKEHMQDYLDESFQPALVEALATVMHPSKKRRA